MKFCREYVPNVQRITTCMERNIRRLSPSAEHSSGKARDWFMHIPATLDQARSTLAVMLGIAATESMPVDIDHATIAAATRYVFHLEPQFGLAGLTPLSPARQAELMDDPELARQAVSFRDGHGVYRRHARSGQAERNGQARGPAQCAR
jgi:hypothetical protein